MQKPTRNSQTCTNGILTWPENSSPVAAVTGHRSHQPSDDIGDVLRGKKVSENEAQNLAKWKPSSGYSRMKEATGSGIVSANAEDTASKANAANSKHSGIFSTNAEDATSEANTGIRVYQQAMNGISQISFNNGEEIISPKKPTSLPEAAKQRELGGTLQNEPGTNSKKLMSSSKTKEIGGNDIFGIPPEIVPRSLAAVHTPDSKVYKAAGVRSKVVSGEESAQKTSRKIHDQKFADLTGNDIFKGDVTPGSVEKPTSMVAKLREMAGSNIFADGKAENRDRLLGNRKHAGGGSNIFSDGKAENRDRLLGARRHAGGGSNIFEDGKAENRDRILGSRRPPGGASSIVLD
ncbi:hypothetical protein MtrunA17_Chr8g0382291 [Medicago truncatula]|uniref:DUF4057 family protein n=1 Tax=Medicago truncatula TaxID=3880 RepID=A0A072TGU4_MEDTR|nr:uncharacterized protein LOC25480791 [Medicago truncatula]KEH16213.1 DUF4057 family protein [Medicago truncatula]RHN42927.1 hypothetical protein MtrunA17_Chr8g0382291 [Medicago truncatula]